MAEIKNNFLKSKMNKDLDDRILPNGEYREAQNVAISKSESSDVGALENILGNSLASSLGLSSNCGITVIGKYMDDTNNRIIIFVTDYTDSSPNRLDNFAPSTTTHQILCYYPNDNTVNTLATGRFLNFSKTHPIYGVNLLEDLLFWTDDRNQPRTLNVSIAETNTNWYNIEETISVCKYYPWKSIRLYKDSGIPTSVTINAPGTGYAPAAGLSPTGGTGAGMVINLNTVGGSGEVTGVSLITPGSNYTNGDVVTIPGGGGNATLTVTTRMDSTMQDVCSEFLPDATVTSVTVTAAGGGYTNGAFTDTGVTSVSGEGSGLTLDGTIAGGVIIGTPTINNPGVGYKNGDIVELVLGGGSGGRMTVTITSTSNPYYDNNWPGDCEYLKDKFVRFSYRFKFEDGQYSLIAPFTQIAFIPEQDGYFIDYDEDRTFGSTEVNFMRNKVNAISLMIDSPEGYPWAGLRSTLKITSMDILYKEADGLSIKVVDTIPAEQFGDNVTKGTTVFEYKYQSTKPIQTLPESEIVRASDKVPIKALAQEITGNRVVYANFLDKHSSPNTLDYNVSAGEKNSESANPVSYVRKEYQNHTLKQNRSYQVGIVLCDKYGRQSDVILSSANSSISSSDKGDTVYHPYKSSSWTDVNLISNTDTWPGDSLKVSFNTLIPSSILNNPGYPGLYDSVTNPLGWYSYKVVVKQTQQGYYNVYFPGILNGYSADYDGPTPAAATSSDPTGFMVLTGDNINKVPKDLLDVGPNQNQFNSGRPTYNQDPSYYQFDSITLPNGEVLMNNDLGGITLVNGENPFSGIEGSDEAIQTLLDRRDRIRRNNVKNANVILYGRVTNYMSTTLALNKRINPGTEEDIVDAISTIQDFGLDDPAGSPNPELYSYQTNPFAGRLSLSDIELGATWNASLSQSMKPVLSIYETEPFTSELDIYWETSTSGLISELNTAIANSDNTIPTSLDNPTITSFTEYTNHSPATDVSGIMYARNNGTILAGATMELASIIDSNAVNVTNKFSLVADGGGGYHLELTSPMYYHADNDSNFFTVYIKVTSTTHVEFFSFKSRVTNLLPVIMNVPGGGQPANTAGGLIYTYQANNGARDSSVRFKELTWIITGQVDSNGYPVNYFFGNSTSEGYFEIHNTSGTPAGDYGVTIKVYDGGNVYDVTVLTVNVS
jgi:hypothetical protein